MSERFNNDRDRGLDDAADRILRDIQGSDGNGFDVPVWESPTRRPRPEAGRVESERTRVDEEWARLRSVYANRVDDVDATDMSAPEPALDPNEPVVESRSSESDPFGPRQAAATRSEDRDVAVAPRRGREDYIARNNGSDADATVRSNWWKPLIIAVVALLVLAGAAVAADWVAYKERVHPGVVVEGIDLGGMDAVEAREALLVGLSQATESSVSVSAGDFNRDISGVDLGLSFDATSMAEGALGVGKTGSFVNNLVDRSRAWVKGVEIPATLDFDQVKVDEFLDAVASEVATSPVQSAVDIQGVEFSVIPGSDGTGVDRDRFSADLAPAFLGEDRTISIDIVPVGMSITPEVAEQGIAVARRMVAEPATLEFEGDTWAIEPATIASWITFADTETPEGWQLLPVVDHSAAQGDVRNTVGSRIGSTAVNATFYVEGDQVRIKPSEKGQGVDVAALVEKMNAGLAAEPSVRTYELSIGEIDPEVTTADAEAMGIKDKLATYTTSYTAGAVNRNTNIHLMADALNGSLVAPGGRWEFHATGGPTTVARGFKPAGAIMNGVAVDEMGGGICQVSTTVFNTIFEAGLPIIQRSPHSRYMSNYPDGRDAAVSWTVPDLVWENNTGNWVLLTSSHTATTVTFTLWGTATGWEVKASNSGWTMLGAGGERQIPNPNMDEGTQKIVQSPQSGRSIVVYRTVTKDGAVVREDQFKSVYRPVDKVVEVGTRPVAAPAPPPPAASTETTGT